MRAGTFLLAALWFSGAVTAGYFLADRSFAWIDEMGSGTSEAPAPSTSPPLDLDALKGMTKAELMEKAKQLTPQQLLCLRASIAPDRVSAVMSGDITPQEEVAARKCLE